MSKIISKVVHILQTGFSLCRFTEEMPQDWPVSHYWISIADKDKTKVTCEKCLEELKKRKTR